MNNTDIGYKYGHLTVIREITEPKHPRRFLCLCDCGNYKTVWKSNLISGGTRSCGCIRKGVNKKYNNFYIKNNVAYVEASNTGNIFMVDAEEWEKIKNICWFEGANGYIQNKSPEAVLLLHRVITDAGKGLVVDHINHNKRDNRRKNLRVCSYAENARNKKEQPKGISKTNNGFYTVQLKGTTQNSYRGCFKTYEEAKEARDKIIREEYTVKA